MPRGEPSLGDVEVVSGLHNRVLLQRPLPRSTGAVTGVFRECSPMARACKLALAAVEVNRAPLMGANATPRQVRASLRLHHEGRRAIGRVEGEGGANRNL